MTDEEYAILVKEAGRHMAKTGKVKGIATLAYELLVPAITALHKANDKPIEPAGPIKESIKKPEAPSDRLLKEGEQPSEVDKGAFDFSALDI
jgi:hypothetical protein